MSLIKLLQEHSTVSIHALKKAMMKDKLVNLLFKKDLSLDSIEDKDAFLASVKYWILNNENVRNFVTLRDKVKQIDLEQFSAFRKLRGSDFTEQKLMLLKQLTKDIFSEYSSVENKKLSPELRKELKDWINSSGRYFNLPTWAMKELMSVPSLRPQKRVIVYRGLLFKEYDFREDTKYDGTLDIGNGLKFAKSIKKGNREVELKWDRPSSWSKDKEVASRFAQFGPASSSFGATLQWLDRETKNKNIDGLVGYVISMFVEPENILLDTAHLESVDLKHTDEGEIIVKPGTYLCRIVKKYTVDSGKVNPDEAANTSQNEISEKYRQLEEFINTFKFPDIVNDIKIKENLWWYDSTDLVRYPEEFVKLINNSTTTQLVHSYDQLVDWYRSVLKGLDRKQLRPDVHVTNEVVSRQAARIKKIVDIFNGTVDDSKFRENNSSKTGKKYELSGEELRNTFSPIDIKNIEKDLMVNGVIGKDSSEQFSKMAEYLGASKLGSQPLHVFGIAKQKPFIDETLDKFFRMVGLSKPTDETEMKKTTINLLRKAARNWFMIQELKRIKKSFGSNNEGN